MPEPLCSCLLGKIHEQMERTEHLIGILAPEHANWTPDIPNAWPVRRVLGHLLECLAGFCAVLVAVQPAKLGYFAKLKDLPINRPCTATEAMAQMTIFRQHIEEGFAILRDADLGRLMPTVFVEKGEPVLTLLLGNLEHLINHKHQLFTYLKLMGAKVGTRDLYHFR